MIAAARQFEQQMKMLQTAEQKEQAAAKLLSANGHVVASFFLCFFACRVGAGSAPAGSHFLSAGSERK